MDSTIATLWLSFQDFIIISESELELAIMPFSQVRNAYLSAGVATRRVTKISANMCLSSLKNVWEKQPISSKVANMGAFKIYENGSPSTGILQEFSEFSLRKLSQFAQKTFLKYA